LANDSQITASTYESLISSLDLFKNDTPYVLLYQKVTPSQVANSEVAASLELSSCVHKKLQEIINHDNKLYEAEERKRLLSKSNLFSKSKSNSQFSWSNDKSSNSKFDKDDNDEDDGSNLNDSSFNKDSGPRIVF
jgi:hypothetical protein